MAPQSINTVTVLQTTPLNDSLIYHTSLRMKGSPEIHKSRERVEKNDRKKIFPCEKKDFGHVSKSVEVSKGEENPMK